MFLQEAGETPAPRSSQPCPLPRAKTWACLPLEISGLSGSWLDSGRLESLACIGPWKGASWMREVTVLWSHLPESWKVLAPNTGIQGPMFHSQNQDTEAESSCTSSPGPFLERKSISWSLKLPSLPQQPKNYEMTAQEPGSVVPSPGNVVDSQPLELVHSTNSPLLAVVKETAMPFSFTPRGHCKQFLFSKFHFIRYFWATMIIVCQFEILYFSQLWINLNWCKTWGLRTSKWQNLSRLAIQSFWRQ